MPRRKALKVVVDVELHAVTCPGVFLPDREDVFINIEIFGQLKRSQYHPPVFPFLFHEKIRFEKVFSTATDPIQVAQELCNETVQIELVQLSYPGGELLGSYVDNARDFLFPTPKVSPTYPGVDREILFERSATFPGIAPKLEFSSRTTIKEVTSSGRALGEKKLKEHRKTHVPEPTVNGRPTQRETTTSKTSYGKNTSKTKPSGKRKKTKSTSTNDGARRGRTMQRSKSAGGGTTMWGYEQPTIASRARSPSPYTRRRMAELSIKDPFETATKSKPFKTEIDSKPEFVVRKVPEDALSLERTPPPPRSPTFERMSPRYGKSSSHRSYTSPRQNGLSPRDTHNYPISNSSDDASDIHTSLRCGRGTPSGSRLSSGRSATSASPRHREPSFSVGDLENAVTSPRSRRDAADSILHRIPLENRLGSQPSPYEKIRDRVRALLSSPRATQIANDAVYEGEERYRRRMSRSPSPRSPRY